MHRRNRPSTLEEVVGNVGIKGAIRSLDLPTPIIFVGERGTGKTTLANIVSTIFGTPPQNLVYVDCANTLTDGIRETIERAQHSSLFGEKKTIILDELHKLPDKAQNALLIPLETLPKNILIIACTTNEKAIIKMLFERFIPLKTKPLTEEESWTLLNRIAEKEGVPLKKQFRGLIVQKAEGIPRRILTSIPLLVSANTLEEAEYLLDVSSMEESEDILQLFKLLFNHASWQAIVNELNSLIKKKSYDEIRIGVQSILAGRIISKYFKEEEGEKLISAFDCLTEAEGKIPQKAHLILSILKVYRRLK